MSKRESAGVYRVVGRVVDRDTGQGSSGLRVEAWDKDLIVDDYVGSAATDPEGRFSLDFYAERFRELFLDRRPDLFFRVYDGERRLASTESSVRWNVGISPTEVVIEVDLPPRQGPAQAATPAISTLVGGRLVAAVSGTALVAHRVEGVLGEPRDGLPDVELGFDLTDAEGRFSLAVPLQVPDDGQPSPKADEPVTLRLLIWAPGGVRLHEFDTVYSPEKPDLGTIVVPVPPASQPDEIPISELVSAAGRPIPPAIVTALTDQGVRTLADVRRTGGFARLDRLPVPADHPALVELEAQASLSLLTPDIQATSRLIDGGFASVSAVAATPQSTFVAAVGQAVGVPQAQQIHAAAVAGASYLDGMVTERLVASAEARMPTLEIPALEELVPPSCGCGDCEAAVSPAAYLADLVDYIRQYIQDGGAAVDLAALTALFYQPFGELPAECDAVETKVRQARICVEVLRRYLQDDPPTVGRAATLAAAERDYRVATYLRLLTEAGASLAELAEVRVAPPAGAGTAEREEHQARLARLADRLGVRPARVPALFLDPTANPNPVTEAALEQLFGLVSTALARNPLDPAQPSRLEQWRLERLADLWFGQDWPSDQLPDGRPIIDPDVIGPDDFRNPTPRATVNDPERAFDIWLRRRRWVDERLAALLDPAAHPVRNVHGDPQVTDFFTGMFAAMYAAVPGLQNPPWQNTQPGDFTQLARSLSTGSRAQVEQARQTLATDLAVGAEAFARLLELREKDDRWVSHPTHPPVSDAEWREVAAILVQAMKRRVFPVWVQEEVQAQQVPPGGEALLEFGSRDFWNAELEPLEGDWPPVAVRPFVDPERVARRDLPEWRPGGEALALWEQRRGELEQIRDALRAAGSVRAAIGRALGDPQNPLDEGALPHDLDDLLQRLNALDPAIAATARDQVEQDLHMSVEEFRDLMEVRARETAASQGPNPPPPPSDRELAEVYTVLTTAEKVERRYAVWAAEEVNPANRLSYWAAFKARLPRWRADGQLRNEWRQALRVRSRRPLLDPDAVERGDLVEPWAGRPAYRLWNARLQMLDTLQRNLAQARAAAANARAGLDAICTQTLGHDSSILRDLERAERDGFDIRARLDQLSLSRREYLHLLGIRRLIDNAGPILDSAWSDTEAILTRVAARRRSALWQAEERVAGITLRPGLFQILEEDFGAPPVATAGSRRDASARREWRGLLSARIDQRQGLIEGVRNIVERVEEATLPQLRDALIDASDPAGAAGTDREAKGKRLADLLLIETRDDGCAVTTRISQAIATLQGFIWSVRTGQLRDTYPGLVQLDQNADERWKWIGSYASWRSALFVHLYPENLLVPALRNEQSWGFRRVLEEVRQRRRQIDSEQACRIARIYDDYYRDIASLRVEASCSAQTYLSGGPCNAATIGGLRPHKYWFARATRTDSQRCYWSRHDPTDPTSQTLWEPIPGLEAADRLVGAVPFRTRDRQELILLFAVVRKEDVDQLVIARYDLSVADWVGAPVELEAPASAESFRAVVVQQRRTAEWNHPDFPAPNGGTARVVVQAQTPEGSRLFLRGVNADATDWEDTDWTQLDAAAEGMRLLAAVPVRSMGVVPFYLFFQASNGIHWYRIFGDAEHPQWHAFGAGTYYGAGTFLGAFLWPSGDQVFVLWKIADAFTRVWRLVPPQVLPLDDLATFVSPQELATLGQTHSAAELPAVVDLHGFNNWLVRAAGVNLNGLNAGLIAMQLANVGNLFQYLTLSQTHPSRSSQIGENLYQATVGLALTSFESYLAGQLGSGPVLEQWQAADRLVLANSQPRLDLAACIRRLFANRINAPQALRMRALDQGPDSSAPSLASLQTLGVDSGMPAPAHPVQLAYTHPLWGTLCNSFSVDVAAGSRLVVTDATQLAPREFNPLLPLGPARRGTPETVRRVRTQLLYTGHQGQPPSNLVYLDDFYYFVPILLATELQRNGHFVAALDWYRTIYDYTEPPGRNRKIWYPLVQEESLSTDFTRLPNWLLDPLNPHAIARRRFHTYTRFTLLSLIGCFLAFADDEFTRDTAESLQRARILYLTALELLDAAELVQGTETCAAVIGSIDVRLSDESWRPVVDGITADLEGIEDLPALRATANQIQAIFAGGEPEEERVAMARQVVDDALAAMPPDRTFGGVVQARSGMRARARTAALTNDTIAASARVMGEAAANDQLRVLLGGGNGNGASGGASRTTAPRVRFEHDPGVAFQFCIPPNPVVLGLRLRAAINLHKLRTCRNIAGVERQVEPYSAPTDTTSGLPVVGPDGQLTLPGGIALRPTPYRFEALVSRAKELVQIAAQMESSMLSAIEKRDQELYGQLTARQQIRLTSAGVRLRDLQVREAEGGVSLAELQQERAAFQVQHFDELIDQGHLLIETASLALQIAVAGGYALASALAAFGVVGDPSQSAGFAAQSLHSTVGILNQFATYERREEEWEYQRDLARIDFRIGEQQVHNAQQHVQVAAQERRIAQLEADVAEQGAEFIANKFGNAELYDWMSDVLEEVYGFFLHQATATARLAVAQVAFERQQVPPVLIRDDYWEVPRQGIGPEGNGAGPDRRGLTGSARLTRDIFELEQFAFDSRQRRLELSRTLSLARLAPFEFARFRETGVLTFATPLELFDRDFPGHYLRQVKRVRVSVVALVPPAEGIRATLTSSRISRVVIGGDIFQTVRIERGPEQVALTSSRDASGVLELEAQSELLRPFEGIGVDTLWDLRMPRAANPFDFSTLADVLLTIDYTALNSFDYQRQVVQELPATLNAERAFSFRNQFADAWYDLHNPDLTATPMTVRFRTDRRDFPPNLDALSLNQLVLYFGRRPGLEFEVPVQHLRITRRDGTSTPPAGAASLRGVISTRQGNAASWSGMLGGSPEGEWELALPNTAEIRNRFQNEEIEDMLLVVGYSGRTPAWPT